MQGKDFALAVIEFVKGNEEQLPDYADIPELEYVEAPEEGEDHNAVGK